MKLVDLLPNWDQSARSIDFLCPNCRRGRIVVALKDGVAKDGRHSGDPLPPDFATLSIAPSVAAEGKCSRANRGCPGWHGFVRNGEVT